MKEELPHQFGNLTLRELPERVYISAFDLDTEDNNPAKRHWKDKFFHNFPGEVRQIDLLLGLRGAIDLEEAREGLKRYFRLAPKKQAA